jgi:SAM-dependent MidA family methyltransferase
MRAAPAAERTALEERLAALIRANGPITIADYMADALGHPQDGYYTSQAAIGAEGDFTTAPEISQIFGELIGLWLVQSWIEMGEPARFSLVELGPGRGVLMADILRAAALRPQFLKAADLRLVEKSGRLRHEQSRRIKAEPRWVDAFAEIAEGPTLLVANEFFDCLPIAQYVRTAQGWRERLVDVAPAGGLTFAVAAAPPQPNVHLPDADKTPIGAIAEVGAAASALAGEIAARLIQHGGRALIIDYGHLGGLGDTLQAVRNHSWWPPLASPGKADITAHVDFDALARAAIEAGAGAWGPATQGAFLSRLGIAERAERLCAGKPPQQREAIEEAVARLVSPASMGEVFKAMAISSPNLPPPAGFEF